MAANTWMYFESQKRVRFQNLKSPIAAVAKKTA